MRPAVLIIERRTEIASVLEEVVESANFRALVTPHLERLSDLAHVPAAIVVRVAFEGISEPAHAAVERLPVNRPPIVAIAWDEAEIAEATRLKCDVVLRGPGEIGGLCDALFRVVSA